VEEPAFQGMEGRNREEWKGGKGRVGKALPQTENYHYTNAVCWWHYIRAFYCHCFDLFFCANNTCNAVAVAVYWLLFCIGFKLQQTLARDITQSLGVWNERIQLVLWCC